MSKSPHSNNTTQRRIIDLSDNTELSVTAKLKNCLFDLHIDESTDISNHRRMRRGAAVPWLENFQSNSVFRASASCSKFLNDKKVSIQ